MSRRYVELSISILLLFSSIDVHAADLLKLNGDIRSNLYVGLIYGDIYNYFNSNVITLKGEAIPDENVSGRFEIRLRNENISKLETLNSIKLREYVEPVSFQLYEGYIQFSSFLFENLDLRVGRQRIAWGTADGFNPTDNFSPIDLEDPLDFKNRLSVNAIMANLYLNCIDISGVLQPVFQPAILPNLDLLDSQSNTMMAGYQEKLQQPQIIAPEFKAKNFIYGLKIGHKGELMDFSLSYYHGYVNIPVLRDIKIESSGFSLKSITPGLVFPKQDVIGLDTAMNLFDIGLFGEMALIFPQKVSPLYYINDTLIDNKDRKMYGLPEGGVSVEDTPFIKFAGGVDYTFRGGYYINLQYIRGFFNELSSSQVNNYIFVYMKKDLFDSRLEIHPSFGFEYDTDNDTLFEMERTDDEKAYIFALEVNYTPFSTGKITIGGAVARGDEGSNLKMFEKMDQVYLRFRSDF